MAEERRRICPTCGKEFITTDPRKKYCTVKCRMIKAYRKYNALHRVERAARLREWRALHKDYYTEQRRKYNTEIYYPKNKERILARNKSYLLQHPEKNKEYQHAYYEKHKDKKRAYMESYKRGNPKWDSKYKPVNRYKGTLAPNETVSYYKDFCTCVGFVIHNKMYKSSKWVLYNNRGKLLTESDAVYRNVKSAKSALKMFMK